MPDTPTSDTPNVVKLYLYGAKLYKPEDLAVYLVWCEPTDNNKFDSIVVPVLGPICDDITHPKGNSSALPDDPDKTFYFPTMHYIKAVAKRIATNMPIDPSNPKSWRPEAYKFSTVRICAGSFQDCIDDEKGRHVQLMLHGSYTFHDMAGDYILDGGTTPVTYDELMDIANEEEDDVSDVIRRIKDHTPPSRNEMH